MKAKNKLYILGLMMLASASSQAQNWTGTWATAPMSTTVSNMPPTDLSNRSIRQIIHVSCGGDSIRLKLTNEYGAESVTIKSVFIADAEEGSNIKRRTAKYLTFNGKRNTVLDKEKAVWSDPIPYKLKGLQRLAITINYGEVLGALTSHPGSRTTSYIVDGEAKLGTSFEKTNWKTDHWFHLSALDVHTKKAGIETIGIIGNSITDGRGSTTNKQDRWTDRFSEAMGEDYGVLNLGIGGNCIDQYGLGDSAVKRYDRDILGQTGVKTVIIFEGVNDIGTSKWDPEHKWVKTSEQTIAVLKKAYTSLIEKAHARGMKVYMGTITAFKGHEYYTPFHELARKEVNEWIRTQKLADGVIDFDALTRDPQDPERLAAKYSDDWLHLNAEGYRVMGAYAAQIVKK